MVHENDPERNGCDFGHFFTTTPQELIDEGLYKTIALALYPMPHREVSLALVAQVRASQSNPLVRPKVCYGALSIS